MSGEISPSGKHSGKPCAAGSSPELRASHADRDQVVDVLRIAAGDALLTADELDERLEAALSARTLSELAPLTADLPPVSATGGVSGAEVKDVVRIEQVHSGAVERVGRWVVPRRLELAVKFCDVTLDFTDAVITQDTLRIDVAMTGKTLMLVTRPGIVVDTDGLHLLHSRINHRQTPTNRDTPVTLRVELVGQKVHGPVVVRPPRRDARSVAAAQASRPGKVGRASRTRAVAVDRVERALPNELADGTLGWAAGSRHSANWTSVSACPATRCSVCCDREGAGARGVPVDHSPHTPRDEPRTPCDAPRFGPRASRRADPMYLEFRFRPGVRDALIGGRLRQEIADVRELVRQEVSAYLYERRTKDDLQAIRHTSAETATHSIAPDALRFARTTASDAPAPAALRLDGIARAFEEGDVSIDAVVGSAAALLEAVTRQVWRVAVREARPASIRVRVLAMGGDGSNGDIEALRRLLHLIQRRDLREGEVTFEARTSASLSSTELYLINGRTVLTSYFHMPGEAEHVLYVQPEDRLEETQEWFNSWWDLLGEA